MKTIKKLMFIMGAVLLLTACGSRQDAIDDLRTLVEDIRENGSDYTAEQWADAEAIFEQVSDELDQNEYTQAEKTEISNLKGEYLAAVTKWKVQDRFGVVKDIVDQVTGAGKSVLEELTGQEKE